MLPLKTSARVGLALLVILFGPVSICLADDDVPFSANVALSNVHLDPNSGGTVLAAFVLTDSANPNCLVTPGESNNVAIGTVIFCGIRAPSLFAGAPGVWIHVFFPYPVVNNLIFTVTVHQNGAKRYGQPVLCVTANGC